MTYLIIINLITWIKWVIFTEDRKLKPMTVSN